jgi:hypothetical protein
MNDYTLLHDPIEYSDGGFKPGTKFQKEELTRMMNLFCFAEDTIIDKDGCEYIVVLHKPKNATEYRHYLRDVKTGRIYRY